MQIPASRQFWNVKRVAQIVEKFRTDDDGIDPYTNGRDDTLRVGAES